MKAIGLIFTSFGLICAQSLLQAQPCVTAPSGLIHWWPGEGNALDYVGGDDGSGASVLFTSGQVGQAFQFNGNNAVSFGANAGNFGTNDFTIEYWMKTSATRKEGFLTKRPACNMNTGSGWFDLRGAGTGGGGHTPWQTGLEIAGPSNSNYARLETTFGLNDGVWHHVGWVREGRSLYVYVDGVLNNSVTTSGIADVANTTALTLGPTPCIGIEITFSFSGEADELAIYNRALSFSEITNIYNAGSAGKCPLPPFIKMQPIDKTVRVGQSATFLVKAFSLSPMNYQWRLNGTPMPGATASSLSVTPQPDPEGNYNGQAYSVIVANEIGSVTSANATLIASTASCPDTSGLIHWWAGEGNAGDYAGGVEGSETSFSYTSGQVGYAFQLNGNNSVNFGTNTGNFGTNDFTIEYWMNKTSTRKEGFLTKRPACDMRTGPGWFEIRGAGTGGGGHTPWETGIEIAGPNFTNYSRLETTFGLNDGLWHHVAWVRQATNLYVYVDGVLDNSTNSTGIADVVNTTALTLGPTPCIGIETTFSFSGEADELAIYNRALSLSEIEDVYEAGSAGKCPDAPSINTQPVDKKTRVGHSVTFSVTAYSSIPMNYQWRLNGAPIPGATASSYSAIPEANPAQTYFEQIYSVIVANEVGSVTSANATLRVNAASCADLTLSPLSNPALGINYSEQITVVPSDSILPAEPLNFTVTSGSLPSGLSLSTNGVLSGKPSALGTSAFTVTLIDANGCREFKNYSMRVDCPIIKIDSDSNVDPNDPALEVLPGVSFNFVFTASGGTPPYIFSYRLMGIDFTPPDDREYPENEFMEFDMSPGGVFTGVIANEYITSYISVDVTDANGCTSHDDWRLYSTASGTTKPEVAITSPVADVTVATVTNAIAGDSMAARGTQVPVTNASFNIDGKAKFKTALKSVRCFVNNREPQFANTTNKFTNWTANILLDHGTNIIIAQGTDRHGRVSNLKTKTIVYVEPTTLTLSTNGVGDIVGTPGFMGTPTNRAALGIGMTYTITAVPRTNYLFRNWTGTCNSNVAQLKFKMERGAALTANFVPNQFITAAGKYNGLFHEAGNFTHQTAGFFSITLRNTGGFSGKLFMDGDTINISGKFNVDGILTKTISRAAKDKGDLTLVLTLSGKDKITGSVSGTDWTSDLEADKVTFSDINPATAYANSYTMLLPGFVDPAVGPSGYNFSSVTVSTNGFVKFNGGTADGMTISQSAPISRGGSCPLYVPMYKTTKVYSSGKVNKSYYLGSLFGWIRFTNSTPTGTINWIKTGWTNVVYPNGFTNESVVFGSRYVVPAIGTRAVDIVNGSITLTNGNLSSAITRNAVVNTSPALTITPTNQTVKLTLAAKNGLLSGSFKHPDNINKVTTIKGAVLQDQKIGGGYFVGTNQGGLMLLEGN